MDFTNVWQALKEDEPEQYYEIQKYLQLHRNNGLPKGSADIFIKRTFVHPALWGPWAASQAYHATDVGSVIEPGPVSTTFRRIFKIHAVGLRGAGRALDDEADAMMQLFIELASPFLMSLWGGMSGEDLFLGTHNAVRRARNRTEAFFRGALTPKDLQRQRKREDRQLLFGKGASDSSTSSDERKRVENKRRKATSHSPARPNEKGTVARYDGPS